MSVTREWLASPTGFFYLSLFTKQTVMRICIVLNMRTIDTIGIGR